MTRGSTENTYGRKALAVTLLAGMMLFPLEAQATANVRVAAETFDDLDQQGQKLSNREYAKSTVTFDTVQLQPESVQLQGQVDVDGEVLPFDLSGVLKKAENQNQLIVGDLEDKLGHFEVIYFGLDRDAERNISLNKAQLKEFKGKKTVFKLYLLKKGTRDFTSVEVVNPSFVDEKALFNTIDTLETTEHIDQFWYAKLLHPVNFEEFEVPQSVVEINGGISTEVIKSTYSDYNYRFTYNVSGGLVYEDFVVHHYLDGPDRITNEGNFNTKLKVKSERTWSAVYPSMESADTETELGYYNSTRLDTYTSPGDHVRSATWAGYIYQGAKIDVIPRWDYGIPNTTLGFTATYSHGKDVVDGYTKVFPASGSEIVRQARSELIKGKRLASTSHYFDTIFNVGYYSLPSSSKRFSVKWTYDVSNGLDYTWGGDRSRELSIGYTNY